MEKETKLTVYLSIRIVEVICIGVFVFGLLWHGTDTLKLTFAQFMMLYGGVGAAVSEGAARIIHRQLKKKIKEGTNNGQLQQQDAD